MLRTRTVIVHTSPKTLYKFVTEHARHYEVLSISPSTQGVRFRRSSAFGYIEIMIDVNPNPSSNGDDSLLLIKASSKREESGISARQDEMIDEALDAIHGTYQIEGHKNAESRREEKESAKKWKKINDQETAKSSLKTVLKVMLLFPIVFLGVLCVGANFAPTRPPIAVIVDVPQLVGKKPEQVEAFLGKPDKCETNKLPGWGKTKGCFYRGGTEQPGGVEIAFIGGHAEWVFVHRLEVLPYEARSVEAMNLKGLGNPETTTIMEWKDRNGYYQVVLFPTADKKRVDHFFLSSIRPKE